MSPTQPLSHVAVKTSLLLVLAGLALAGSAAAQASPDPLAVETWTVDDQKTEAFAYTDGYDVDDVFVRDAYWEGSHGLVFRITLFGGPPPAGPGDTLEIGLATDRVDQPLRVATTDGETWTGDLTVVQAAPQPNEAPEAGHSLALQVFAPREVLDVAVGDEVTGLTVTSAVGVDTVDRAPGGWGPPGSGSQTPVPEQASQRETEAYPVEAPTGYVDVNHTWDGGQLTVSVENRLDNGQHVELAVPELPGWRIEANRTAASLDAGDDAELSIEAVPRHADAGPLQTAVLTDLGGRQPVSVSPGAVAPASSVETSEEDNPAPLPAVSTIAALTLGGLLLRRRP